MREVSDDTSINELSAALRNAYKELEAFFTVNPGFDLLTFDFHDKSALAQLQETERSEILSMLKPYQRLLRIEPDIALAQKLLAAGFDSAHAISALSEPRFVRDYAHLVDGNEQRARAVHVSTTEIKTYSQHLHANLHGTLGSPHYRNAMGFA